MHLTTFYIFLVLGCIIDAVCSREMRTLILYDRPMSWQNANDHCIEIGYNLLVIDSEDVILAMQKIKPDVWSTVTDRLWIGLHAPKDNNNQRTPFKWLKGCLPLDESINVWKTGQPQSWGYCALVDPANQFQAEIMGCNNNFRLICQKSNGQCDFEETAIEATVTGALSTITIDNYTENECMNRCLQTNLIEECWAITFAGNTCTLHLAKSAFYFEDKMTPQVGSKLFMKRCFRGLYYDFNSSPSPSTIKSNSDPESQCNSSSTQLTAIEKYNLVPFNRQAGSIELFEDTLTRNKAKERCTGNGGNLVYIDRQIQHLIDNQLPVWMPSTNMWIGVTDIGWDSGQSISFENDGAFPATTLHKTSGKWLSTNIANKNQFICQKYIGDCDFEMIQDKAIGSSMSDPNVTLDLCQMRCKNYAYNGNDCWAVTYGTSDRVCLYHFSNNPEIALDSNVVVDGAAHGLSLYRKVCYSFTVVPATATSTPTPASPSSSYSKALSSSSSHSETSSSTLSSPFSVSNSASPSPETPSSSSYPESPSPSSSQSETPSSSSYPESPSLSQSSSQTQTQSSSPYLDLPPPTTESSSPVVEVTASDQSSLSTASSPSFFPTPVINSKKPTTTSIIANVSQYDNQTCLCVCNHEILKLDSPELAEKLKVISSELFIDPKEVSASKRKFISVDDPRPSARAVGSVLGITTLCLVFGFLILMDVQKLVSWFVEYMAAQNKKRK